MNRTPYKVLILCTGNSARSIIAEYLLRAKSHGRFEVFSAGAKPAGQVNPLALWVLREHYGIDASGARSKSWDEFRTRHFDFIITVCDDAKEKCPIWPGQPIVAHWSSPDPAGFNGTEDEKEQFFVQIASQICQRIDLFCAFPDDKLEPLAVHEIGEKFKIAAVG
ncbi:MAG TPA: arsenate reductase ArsC [Candidatus Didemnitutus sp.]|nr:arsenate reductase ArsC [Candidatus Didemnitutus sp.]